MEAPSNTHPLDIRILPQTREVTAYHDGGLFPVLALAPGGVMVVALRGGAGHLGLSGRMEIIRSLDAGQTWSPPIVVADSDRDDRNPALGVSAEGTVVLAYHRQGSYADDGTYDPYGFGVDRPVEVMITRSRDAGLTWEKPVPLTVDALRTGSPFGKVVSPADGTLLLPIYHYDRARTTADERQSDSDLAGSYFVRSRDDGATWEGPSLIARGMNETALLALADGSLLAVMRGSDAEAALWSTRSDDGGQTWTQPERVTGSRQHPADLIQLASGDVLLTYGNRNPPYRIEGRVSRDGGRSWRDGLLAFSGPLYGANVDAPRVTDLGYPSSIVRRESGSGQGVTMYYYNPSTSRDQDHRAGGPTSGFYRAQGYVAVAVTWDEADLMAAVAEQLM